MYNMISDKERAIIRECARDAAAYERLIALFEARDARTEAPPATTQPHTENYAQLRKQMFDAVQVVQLMIDPDSGRIVDANQAALEFYGYTLEELRALNIYDINTLSNEQVYAEMQHSRRREINYFEFKHRLSSGEIHDVDVYASPVTMPDGRQLLYSIIIDATNKRDLRMRYEALFQQINDGVSFLDLDLKHVAVNQRGADMFGYTIEEIINLTTQDLVMPEEYPESVSLRERLLAGETIPPYERVFRHKDGYGIPVELNVQLVRDAQGEPRYILSIARDITRRKTQQERLINTNEALSRLIQQIPVGVQVFDVEGVCTDVNQAHLDIFGIPREALIGQYNILRDTLANHMPTHQAAVLALMGETVTLGDLTFDFSQADERYADITQPNKIINVKIVPIFSEDGSVINIVGVNTDVSERHSMVAALRQSEERYRGIVENLDDTCVLYDADLSFIMVNSKYLQQTGYTEDQVIGKRDVDLVPPEIAALYMPLLEAARDTKTLQVDEVDFPAGAGNDKITTLIKYVPLLDAQDNVQQIIGLGTDITERNNARERAYQFELEKERLMVLQTFIQDASHEFRTPLSIISTNLYMMARIEDADTRKERQRLAERQITRIKRLVDMLSFITKVQSQYALPDETTNVISLIRMICDSYQDRYSDGPALNCEELVSEFHVQAVADFLYEALSQVLDNAFQHTPQDGTIDITGKIVDDGLQVQVRDSGSGIPPELLPHVFKSFIREDVAHSSPGFGLGLAIVKSVIDKIGGTITITSSAESGTTVTMLLPSAAL